MSAALWSTFPADHAAELASRGQHVGGGAPYNPQGPAERWAATLRLAEMVHSSAGVLLDRLGEGARPPQAPLEPRSAPAFRWEPGERDRIALRPIRHDDIWQFRKKIEALHWTAQEIDLTRDKADWSARMTEEERHFVKHQLAFFARIDIDVLDNLGVNFGEEVDCLEAKFAYAAQADQECVHAESYALQIEAVMSGAERDEVFHAVRTMPVIGKMRDWALQWFDRAHPIGDRLVAFAAIEGVLFQSPFAALQWLREKNLLPGITESNELIMRDEGIHTLHTCLYVRKYLAEPPPRERAEAIFGDLVAVLDEFISESLPVRLIGMNDELMRQYVRYQADSVLLDMGFLALFGAENPFPFMDKISLNEIAKVNFFERTVTQYQSVTREGASRLALDTSAVVY